MANEIVGTRSPNGAVGVRGVADSGELSMLSAGALSGFSVAVDTGFNLLVGGVAGVQDVAVSKNSAGESDLLVGNGTPLAFTLPGAPGTSGQAQIHSLVLWKDAAIVSTVNDGLDAVGYQVVSGASATTGTQVPPSEAEIRAEIPNGATAFMAVVVNTTLVYGDESVIPTRISPNPSVVSMTNGGAGQSKVTYFASQQLGIHYFGYAWGPLCVIRFNGAATSQITDSATLVAVPSNFKPAGYTFGQMFGRNGYVDMTEDGVMSNHTGNIIAGTPIYGQITYDRPIF